ncbi:MAG: hypothetical protein M1813_004524 [Trichoglossum hirsutum]|nr:MAG: hypothetical protein M1813_004524 [Trichoglossum hirsutum]
MNNAQFRRLLLDTPAKRTSSSEKTTASATPSRDGASLGSKMRSSIPMTPRSVMGSGGVDFARQLAERDQAQQPQRKFRSSAAPKGAKLPSGYRDRTQDRVSSEEDDKARRVQALEETWKLGQIDRATFEKLRDEIVGGDISSTHLIKGLDYKLLERVRKGEDVLNKSPASEEKTRESTFDEELEKLEDKEIKPITKQKIAKKGEMAPPPGPGAVAGRKRTRDDILAELKASRQAAKAAQQPALGPKFRKIGGPMEKSRIERDERGREVLITVDKDGKIKRKVRTGIPGQNDGEESLKSGLLMPEKGAKPLGMEVPDFVAKAPTDEPEEDPDIFEGVGAEYDPLAGLEDDDDDDNSSSEDGEDREPGGKKPPTHKDSEDDETKPSPPETETATLESDKMPPPPPLATGGSAAPRNYFSTPIASHESSTSNPTPTNPLADPTILAALRKASSMDPLASSSFHDPEEAAREARRQKLLDTHDRDADDMDLGFGSSRFEDEEDMEEKKVKLSAWGGGGDDGKEGRGDGKGKRKRGPKKRKGDVNSAADVMKVIERRKGGGG